MKLHLIIIATPVANNQIRHGRRIESDSESGRPHLSKLWSSFHVNNKPLTKGCPSLYNILKHFVMVMCQGFQGTTIPVTDLLGSASHPSSDGPAGWLDPVQTGQPPDQGQRWGHHSLRHGHSRSPQV